MLCVNINVNKHCVDHSPRKNIRNKLHMVTKKTLKWNHQNLWYMYKLFWSIHKIIFDNL